MQYPEGESPPQQVDLESILAEGDKPLNQIQTQALVSGLRSTYKLHQNLGEAGTEDQQLNSAGEMAMALDVQSEEQITKALSALNIPMVVFSEEHGQFTIGEKYPRYLVSLDGLDGSGEYSREHGKGMYGAMAAVLRGIGPVYENYLAAGVMIHSPIPHLYLAVKGKGVFDVDLETLERRKIQRDNNKKLSRQTSIDLDRNWEPYGQVLERNQDFPNMGCAYFSAAARIALFVEGKVDLALEWTRKGNLEHPVMYALARELGAVMTDARGVSLAREKFRDFGQISHVPVIIAPNYGMARAASARFNLWNLESQIFTRIG